MRLSNQIIIVISFFILFIFGCKSKTDSKLGVEENTFVSLLSDINPDVSTIDSLIIKGPGINTHKKPTTTVTRKPRSNEILFEYKVFPGKSYLKPSIDEKITEIKKIKSEFPLVVTVDHKKSQKIKINDSNLPIKRMFIEPMLVQFDSIGWFKEIAIRRGKFDVVMGDTIYPPMKVPSKRPELIKAAKPRYKYDALIDMCDLTSEQHLPNSFIRGIVKDSSGLFWFVSHFGNLISYDGQYFNSYDLDQGITQKSFKSIIIDSKGKIWIGTLDGGIICFDGKYFTYYTIFQGLNSNSILSLFESKNGIIWAGTKDGLHKIEGNNLNIYTQKQGLVNDVIYSICENKAGVLWLGTQKGISSFINGEFTWITRADGLTSNKILSCFVDSKDILWIGTRDKGVVSFDGKTLTSYGIAQGLENNIILDIVEDKDQKIWFATFGNGVTSFDGSSFVNYTTKDGLIDNYIRTLFVDDNNTLWISTDGSGISIFTQRSYTHFNKNNGLSNDLVLSMYQDRMGRNWFGTFEGGIMIYENPKNKWDSPSFTNITTKQGIVSNTIMSITQDINDDYWVATFGGGVSKIDADSFEKNILRVTNYTTEQGLNSNVVNDIIEDHNGNIWFATNEGACKMTSNGFFESITNSKSIGNSDILDIFLDDDKNLWFGTYTNGAFRLTNDTIYSYKKENGLANNRVWVIDSDAHSNLLLGTNGGINYFMDDKLGLINTINGLSNNNVYSIVTVKDTTIWIGTTNGLNHIKFRNPIENKPLSFFVERFHKNDGIISDDFYHKSSMLDDNNYLWFGTIKGLLRFNYTSFNLPSSPPLARIKEIWINNEPLDFNALKFNKNADKSSDIRFDSVPKFTNIPMGLSLEHNLNHVTFIFSSSDGDINNTVNSQYMLEGFDKDWISNYKHNVVDYKNLNSGSYTFKLRVFGPSGLMSDEVSYSFQILPPVYSKWWAFVIYFVLGVLIFALIIRWRVNIVKKQKLVLKDRVVERTKDLDKALDQANKAGEAKSNFIAMVSHELRTPLNAIMGLTHLAINRNPDPKQGDYLKKIDRSATTLLSLINEILDFSKIEAGKMKLEDVNFDLDVLINSVAELNTQMALDKGLDFIFNVNADIPRNLIGDPLRIGQVFSNLISNSIKFTEKGEIIINIDFEKAKNKNELVLIVNVKDTGIGISKDKIPALFEEFEQADNSITRSFGGTGLGLSISKRIIELMNGHISIESVIGEGTTIAFDLKVGIGKEQPKNSSIYGKLSKYNFLICDSNEKTLNTIQNIFLNRRLNVDSSSNFNEVLEKVRMNKYDVLFIDILDLENKREDLISQIRLASKNSELKVITMTKKPIDSSQNYNSDGHISKPINPSFIFDPIISIMGLGEKKQTEEDSYDNYYWDVKRELKNCKVLIAEDNELSRQVVIELLNIVGVDVDTAINGKDAHHKTMEKTYDIILLDLHMPIMDGYQSAIQIRLNNSITPIIAITADAMESVLYDCRKSGMNDVITKPINPKYLYDRLIYWVSRIKPEDNILRNNQIILANNVVFSGDENLDFILGIKRFGNNQKLYLKMLNKFLDSINITCQKIKEFQEKGDTMNAHLLAHTLKGESGNIGATLIALLASQIEQKITSNVHEPITDELKQIEDSILLINKKYKDLIQGSKEGSVLKARPLKVIIDDIIDCLNNKNIRVFDLLDEIESIEIDPDTIFQLKEEIKNDNIEKAILILHSLMIT